MYYKLINKKEICILLSWAVNWCILLGFTINSVYNGIRI